MSILLLSAILFSQAGDTTQPVLTWEPQMPAWGDTVTLFYHHSAPKASLKGLAPLLVNFQGEPKEMERKDDVSVARFLVPDSISTVRVSIHTIETLDWQAYKTIPLEVPEGWSSSEEKLEELRRSFSLVDAGYIPREEALRLLDSLRTNPTDNADYRFICMLGFLKLGNPDSAWSILEQMHERDKGSSKYHQALVYFAYDVSDGKIDPGIEKVSTLNRWIDDELLIRGSYSISLLGLGVSRWAEDNTHLSIKQQGKILKRFVEKNPFELHSREMLIRYYLRVGDTVEAETQLSNALKMNLENVAQKERGHFSTTSSDMVLSGLMLERGRLHAAQGRFDEALADFSFVILLKDDNEGAAFFERAKVWQRLERYRRAEGSFVKALKAGYAHAEPALKGIYLLNYGKEGFDEYLTEKLKPSEDEELRMTKDFGFKDLDGNTGRFFDYRGKIVVVNYWGLGCGPCKKEIPWLNELAEAYEETGVEFLAFSLDNAEAQKAYFEKRPFKYHNLIPDGKDFFTSIGLSFTPLPWHCIVDPQGRIRFKRIGGREDNSDLKLIIDQLLREQRLVGESK